MNSIHAIKRERDNLRLVQAKAVMPKIGPLLDAWEGLSNDLRGQIMDEAPKFGSLMARINDAMEASPSAEEAY